MLDAGKFPSDSGTGGSAAGGGLSGTGGSTDGGLETGPKPDASTCAAKETCDDLLDNDCDGKTDCEDSECLDQACKISKCSGAYCNLTPKCVGTNRKVPKCVWTGTNCQSCPDGFAVKSFDPKNGCIDGNWYTCNVPAGSTSRFYGPNTEHPGGWSKEVPGCAICNAHGPAIWEVWYE